VERQCGTERTRAGGALQEELRSVEAAASVRTRERMKRCSWGEDKVGEEEEKIRLVWELFFNLLGWQVGRGSMECRTSDFG
jgi:hypothetical protein